MRQVNSAVRHDRLFRWFAGIAIAGAAVWVGHELVPNGTSPETALIEALLLFAPLVIVPLGLAAVAPTEQNVLWRVLMIAQPLGAVLLIASFRLGPGLPAALFASVWLLTTVIVAVLGFGRLIAQKVGGIAEFSVAAGLMYILVGGVWLVLSRLGVEPMGFGSTIVLLTAVHFHYAGFAAPIIAGCVGRRLDPARPRILKTYQIAAGSVIAAPALVAVGITTSPLIEVFAAFLLAMGLLVLAAVILTTIVPVIDGLLTRILLIVSSASLVATMGLACEYALGEYVVRAFIDIPLMAKTHGVINTLGFALCGMLACCRLNGPDRSAD